MDNIIITRKIGQLINFLVSFKRISFTYAPFNLRSLLFSYSVRARHIFQFAEKERGARSPITKIELTEIYSLSYAALRTLVGSEGTLW